MLIIAGGIVLAILFLLALPFITVIAANLIVIGLVFAVLAAIGLGIFYFGNSAVVYLSSGVTSQASPDAHSLLALLLFFVVPLVAFCAVVAKGRKVRLQEEAELPPVLTRHRL
jgi:hypothetical protein